MMGMDTYVMPQSYDIARLAAGGVIHAVDTVMRGESKNALAAIRPPGHHATISEGMGFCLLNNIAIAARHIQRTYKLQRILIVDYDVHHGNGTQDIFYDDPSVLYISTHQSPLYPGTGTTAEVGAGSGLGYTINIPMPPGVGDQGYLQVFEQIVCPAVERFEPQFILVSVGFDAHWADPLAHMKLSLSGYDRLARQLITLAELWCEGRIVFVLEGGYNLEVLSHGWVNVGFALLGDNTLSDPLGDRDGAEPPLDLLVSRLKQLHKLS